MNDIFLAAEWFNSVPINIAVVLLGILLSTIGVIWLLVNKKRKSKNASTKLESNDNFWFRVESETYIYGLILVGFITVLNGIFM